MPRKLIRDIINAIENKDQNIVECDYIMCKKIKRYNSGNISYSIIGINLDENRRYWTTIYHNNRGEMISDGNFNPRSSDHSKALPKSLKARNTFIMKLNNGYANINEIIKKGNFDLPIMKPKQ